MRNVTVYESSRELSARERIAMKDTSKAQKLDELIPDLEKTVVIYPVDYAILHVSDDSTDSKEYDNLIVIDETGEKYYTGSKSFIQAFVSIWTEMQGENEPFKIECYKLPSKNYKGKFFLTCSIL